MTASSVVRRMFSRSFVVRWSYVLPILIGAIVHSSGVGFIRCPTYCICRELIGYKRVSCDAGGMTSIPVNQMDKDIRVLIVTAPKEHQNQLTLGRIFSPFTELEEIRITHSNIPAIGHGSFYPGKKLQLLDLSHNNMTMLNDFDFLGLNELRMLNLSHNHIAASPSAPFRHLTNLTSLILSNNQLDSLVPRFFYLLKKLQRLDLSGNPLKFIDHENLKDLRPLRILNLANCQLTGLHSLVYQQLPNLESLNLQDNQFTYFAPQEFRHLQKIRVLKLDGNRLTTLPEKMFDGQTLTFLGLSRNQLSSIAMCAFCNTSIEELDLSRNKLNSDDGDPLRPLSLSLDRLDLSFNPLSGSAVSGLVKSLNKLTVLNLEALGLYDLPGDTFDGTPALRRLILAHNHFTSFIPDIFSPMRSLETLDLSNNQMGGMHPYLLDNLEEIQALSRLILHDNPWVCYYCHVMPIVRYLEKRPLDSTIRLPECSSPPNLAGRQLTTLTIDDLEQCKDPIISQHFQRTESQVGLIVAIIIIMVLVMIIIATIIVYRHQGAVYYTHEDERGSQMFDQFSIKDPGYDSRRPSIIPIEPPDPQQYVRS